MICFSCLHKSNVLSFSNLAFSRSCNAAIQSFQRRRIDILRSLLLFLPRRQPIRRRTEYRGDYYTSSSSTATFARGSSLDGCGDSLRWNFNILFDKSGALQRCLYVASSATAYTSSPVDARSDDDVGGDVSCRFYAGDGNASHRCVCD